MPTAMPGRMARPATVFPTALAAMETVPRVEMKLSRISLPSWNMLFSTALGMPMVRMFRIS